MADDLFGSEAKPVPAHPIDRIVEYHNPLATVAILRTGERDGPYHHPSAFQRVSPIGMTVPIPDSLKLTEDEEGLYNKGSFPPGVTRVGFKPPWIGITDEANLPSDTEYATDRLPVPVRAEKPVNFEDNAAPGEGRHKFPPNVNGYPIPAATPSGAGTLTFDDMYLWFVGWAGETVDVPGTDNLIINLAKLRKDFATRSKDDKGKVKVTPAPFIEVRFLNGLRHGESTGPVTQFWVTFEVYAGGDRGFSLDTRTNASYGSGRLIARKTKRVAADILDFHRVKYTFKTREIEFTGVD